MIPIELMTMVGGAASGFIFKFMAQSQKYKHDEMMRAIKRTDAIDNSSDKAAQRGGDYGKVTRRLIVICILFAVILAPFIAPFFNIPTIVEVERSGHSWFFGLFKTGPISEFVHLFGFLMIEEVKSALTYLLGFYFGSGAAKVTQ